MRLGYFCGGIYACLAMMQAARGDYAFAAVCLAMSLLQIRIAEMLRREGAA